MEYSEDWDLQGINDMLDAMVKSQPKQWLSQEHEEAWWRTWNEIWIRGPRAIWIRGAGEGALEVSRDLLLMQIEEKLGPPSIATRGRLLVATQEQIFFWAKRILKVESVDELFQD